MTIKFGSFEGICETAALVICPLVESNQGVEPTCYSRNVDVGGTLIFQPCEMRIFPCEFVFSDMLSTSSDMLHPHRRHLYDCYHDLSHS